MIARARGAARAAGAVVLAVALSPLLMVTSAAQLRAEDTLGIDPAEGL